jgi:hypothetical protein
MIALCPCQEVDPGLESNRSCSPSEPTVECCADRTPKFMNMDFTTEVFPHSLDEAIVAQIDTLRTIRINIAESMLQNLPDTSKELSSRGILEEDADTHELRQELERRISVLKSRLQDPYIIYVDEIRLYMNLVEAQDEADIPANLTQ